MTEDSKPPDNHLQMSAAELERFPPPVVDNFRRSHEVLSGRLAEETVQQWSDVGLAIARKTVRSWEAAAEYFDASPAVQQQLPAGQFLRWARTGSSLCDDSPSLAVAYFRASPAAILRLRPRYIDDWAMIGRSLYRGTWKSSALSCRVFEGTPKLLETIFLRRIRAVRGVPGGAVPPLLRRGLRVPGAEFGTVPKAGRRREQPDRPWPRADRFILAGREGPVRLGRGFAARTRLPAPRSAALPVKETDCDGRHRRRRGSDGRRGG